jgi:hypothetical protein
MFKETCTATGKVIRGYTIDEFLEKWNKHIESLKIKNEEVVKEPIIKKEVMIKKEVAIKKPIIKKKVIKKKE